MGWQLGMAVGVGSWGGNWGCLLGVAVGVGYWGWHLNKVLGVAIGDIAIHMAVGRFTVDSNFVQYRMLCDMASLVS